ncbi:MAG TPA: flippase [Bryobacteraceae bacterium]|nr:flippase [Bryobacteraceae bacterium]
MIRRISDHLGEGVLSNIVSLYGAYVVNYAVPLVTVPYLVRTLGPQAWGTVAIAQGYGNSLCLIVEYGFNLSATREVARHRDSPERLSDLVAGVVGAKLALVAAGCLLAMLVQRVIPSLAADAAILWAAVLAGCAVGLNSLWYFQGRERMEVVAGLDVGTKLVAASGVFLWVRHPADAWLVPGLQAAASVLTATVGLVLVCRETRLKVPRLALVHDALRSGWSLFLFQSSAMLYTAGNAFLLGLFAPPEAVAYFSGAEKISRAAMGVLNPFNQALFPRLSRLMKHSPEDALKLFRTNAAVVATGGVVLGTMLYLAAPLLVRILLGAAFQPSVPVLRLLAVLPLLIGINTLMSMQWMVPLGLYGILTRVVLSAGVLNVCLASLLASRYQQMGMAIAVVGAESFIALSCATMLWRRTPRMTISLAEPEVQPQCD